jgi:hypothetical protein
MTDAATATPVESGGGAASSGAGSSPEAGTKGPANDNGGQKSASSDNGTQSSKQAGDSYGSSSSASFKGQYESGMGGPAGSNDNKASADSSHATKADNSTTSAANYDKGAASTQFNKAAADKQSPAPEGTPPGGGKGGGKGGGGKDGDGGDGDGGDKGGKGGGTEHATTELVPGLDDGNGATKQGEDNNDSASDGTPKSPQMQQSLDQFTQWKSDYNADGTEQQDSSQTTAADNSDNGSGSGKNMPDNVKANPEVTDAGAALMNAGVTSAGSEGNAGGTSGGGNQEGSTNARGRSPSSTKKSGPGLG